MGVTYTTAADRGRSRGVTGVAWTRDEVTLVLVGVVSLALLAVAYAGRMSAFGVTEGLRTGPVVNLAGPLAAADVEPALAPVFDNERDRRFAAAELVKSVQGHSERLLLPNVGALAGLQVDAGAIDAARGLERFRIRLADARSRADSAKHARPEGLPLFTMADITTLKPGFVVRTAAEHRATVFWCVLALVLSFQAISLGWRWRGVQGDRVLLAAVHLLVALGATAMLSRPDPLRDTFLLVRYTEGVLVASLVCLAVSSIRITRMPFVHFTYLSLAAAIALAVILIVFGTGPGSSGAKVNLGPLQPAEFIRLLLVFFLAGYLGRRWELIRQIRETEWRGRPLPSWLNVPRLDHLVPVVGGVLVALLLFFALRDLGPALLVSLTFLTLLSVARAGLGAIVAGMALLAAGFFVGYWFEISGTLGARVAMWRDPWDNAVRGGDQVAQAAWSLAAGAVSGTGLGLGDTRYLPAGHTDLVLASIGEELGLLGVCAAAAATALVGWRGLRLARRAPTDATFFLGAALTLSLIIPVLVMAAGTVGLLPLTGVVTPFISYGGSAMLANFTALGLLVAIGASGTPAVDTRPFAGAVRGLGIGLGAAAAVVLVAWVRLQAVSADDILVRPQLSLQADGGRRYQYNPRVLDAARGLPRGAILDRRDVPLAGDVARVTAGKGELDRLRIALRDACPDQARRCYPFGGRLFHLVGNADTRTNWSATNSSYVERDAESRLRGFDDRAESVRTGQDEDSGVALRRDYRDVVPLVRHKWEPDHESVKAIREKPRDIHLTIDARLQQQVATLTSRAMTASGAARSAVVVLDAPTGEILASVSYPWPSDLSAAGDSLAPDALLDRARYGLYPPGSTFKLVTAAAALRLDPDLHNLRFTCSRLPDGRVGARIPGWSRPIRDDVLDRHPHGTQTMRDGVVRSCNAYFAQLAVRLGVEPLGRMADAAGLVFPSTGDSSRARETLPHAGFGQGDVLATPLRMARLAAAIGTDGSLREPGIVREPTTPAAKPFLPERSARVLADDMRAVVTDGTGRLLSNHSVRIAGKTGTAEVDDAPSHAWFIGFAPAGAATRRIAFAVLIEHAGYGGASAASLAGQVVTAAASLGLAR